MMRRVNLTHAVSDFIVINGRAKSTNTEHMSAICSLKWRACEEFKRGILTMKMMSPVRARLTIICGKKQMLVSPAMVPIVAAGFSHVCRYVQPSPAFLKPSNQVAMRRQFAFTLDMAKVSLQGNCDDTQDRR